MWPAGAWPLWRPSSSKSSHPPRTPAGDHQAMPHRSRPDPPRRRPGARRRRLPALFGWLALALLAFAASCGGGNQPSPGTGGGWRLTVYYTPVESYHGGSRDPISGCQGADLGSHSHELLTTIKTEGFGRLATPVEGRSHLGWDFDRRCWFLAAAPVGANDRPLRPWVSTAAHPNIAIGTRVSVRKCGGQLDRSLCDRVRGGCLGGRRPLQRGLHRPQAPRPLHR